MSLLDEIELHDEEDVNVLLRAVLVLIDKCETLDELKGCIKAMLSED